MRRVLAGLVVLAELSVRVASVLAEDNSAQQQAIRTSVEQAMSYLQDRGETWKDSRQCASCHHVPLMTWAMHEVRRHGIAIDEDIHQDAMDWFYADNDPAKIFNKFNAEEEEYDNPLSLVSVYALMSAINDPKEPEHRAFTVKMLQGIVEAQEADGSWKPIFGRAPIMATREQLTLWLYDLTSWPGQPEELKQQVAETRRRAAEWLKTHHTETETHILALRLWMLTLSGHDSQAVTDQIDELIKLQRDDGGWSQIPSRASDAYATGHVLYAFQLAGVPHDHPALQRGIDFLLKSQAKDGSWPMISRENPPLLVHAVSAVTRKPVLIAKEPNTASSRNAEPISFIASAWATVALARMLP